jgi:hypothetical protein
MRGGQSVVRRFPSRDADPMIEFEQMPQWCSNRFRAVNQRTGETVRKSLEAFATLLPNDFSVLAHSNDVEELWGRRAL